MRTHHAQHTSSVKKSPKFLRGAFKDTLERQRNRAEPVEQEELNQSERLLARDAVFESELQYDGYKDIEDYDNGVYSAGLADDGDTLEALNFEYREEENIPEENLVDPQGNKD